MKLKSSLTLIVAAFLVLSCATVGPKSAPQLSDSQTMAEETLVSGIQYYLEDIDNPFVSAETIAKQTSDSGIFPDYFAILSRFHEDPFSTTAPVAEQTLVSGIQYYLEDIYDYDDAFFVTQPVIRQIPDYFAILSKFNEDPFSTAESAAKQTLVSGI